MTMNCDPLGYFRAGRFFLRCRPVLVNAGNRSTLHRGVLDVGLGLGDGPRRQKVGSLSTELFTAGALREGLACVRRAFLETERSFPSGVAATGRVDDGAFTTDVQWPARGSV